MGLEAGGHVEQDPENARFSWQNGVVSVLRPDKDGRHLEIDKTVDMVMAQSVTTNRTVDLPVSVTKPDVSQDIASKLNIDGPIEVARTSFAGASPPKRANITLATQRLNGVAFRQANCSRSTRKSALQASMRATSSVGASRMRAPM